MPNVTVIMPVRNARHTVLRALASLKEGCEDCDVRIWLCDNDSDDKITNGLVHSAALRFMLHDLGFDDVRILSDCSCHMTEDGQVDRPKNMEHMMAKFAYEISMDPTAFVFRLDSDVVMPKGGLKACIDRIMDKNVGCVGIRYTPGVQHVQAGCTLWRWKAVDYIRKIGFGTCKCECNFIHEELVWHGWKVEYLDGYEAKHIGKEDA